MGLTLFYNGKFGDPHRLAEMIDEVKDIAETHEWPYQIFEKSFPQDPFPDEYDGKIYGIYFIPPHCEPVYLTFLSNGRMGNPIALDLWKDSDDPEKREYIYLSFTKTQFGGIEIHQLIVHLLRYVSEKYLSEIEVRDDGNYWETNDEEVLRRKFEDFNRAFDMFSDALSNIGKRESESVEAYLNRVLNQIEKGKKD